MKTSQLQGAALDWAVAAAENLQFNEDRVVKVCRQEPTFPAWIERESAPGSAPHYHRFTPSTNWAHGGPIIDREGIDLYCNVATNPSHPDKPWRGSWRARYCRMGYGTEFSYGATALEAAMRCYVASKLGDDVVIPGELR